MLCAPQQGSLWAQDSAAVKDAAKDAKKAKKAEGFFKKLFHHDDSAKKARQYIREQQRQVKRKPGSRFTVESDTSNRDAKPYMDGFEFDLDYEVLGWYPHWEKDYYKQINYSLLTTVAYFSYELDPRTGEPKTVYDWETTPLIKDLTDNNKRVLLTVTNFGNNDNRVFLRNSDAQEKLIENLITLLKKRGAHGVCIDFEGVPKSHRDNLTRFMTLLNQSLKSANPGYLIYMAVPAVNWQKSINPAALNPVVDRFAIMGYNYYGSMSKVAGPVNPLKSGKQWEPFNLMTSVNYYLKEGIPASKMILALPYYGSIWETRNSDMGSEVVKYAGARTYDYIKTNIKAPIRYDTISYSAWQSYIIRDGKRTIFRQAWFDNDSTFSVKLNYIKSKKLAGMGIWALGYDKGYDDLWKVIATSMTTKKVYPVDGVTHNVTEGLGGETPGEGGDPNDQSPGEAQGQNADEDTKEEEEESFWSKLTDIEGLLENVTNYKTILLFIMTLVVLYGGIGMLIAMFQPNTRAYFFNSNSYVIYYTSFVLLFLVVALRWKNILQNSTVGLIVGFIAGGVCVWLVMKVIQRIHRDMP